MLGGYKVASESSQVNTQPGKKLYNKKVWNVVLMPFNRVLLQNMSERGGPRKLNKDRTGKMKSPLSSSRRINIFQCARSDQCQDQRNLECYTETCCFLVPTDLLMNIILKSRIG